MTAQTGAARDSGTGSGATDAGAKRRGRIRLGSLAIAVGLVVQIATHYLVSTESFVAFLLIGGGLVVLGILLALPAVVGSR